jgi:hypothetical protein
VKFRDLDDDDIGIYVDPTNGKVILHVQRMFPIHFDDLGELEGLLERLGHSVEDIKLTTTGQDTLKSRDESNAVEEVERMIVENLEIGPLSDPDGHVGHEPSVADTGPTIRKVVGANRFDWTGYPSPSYWKVTLTGMVGRNKTKLVSTMRSFNDLTYLDLRGSVDTCPSVVSVTRTKSEAQQIKRRLEAVGGEVELGFGVGLADEDRTQFLWELHLVSVPSDCRDQVVAALETSTGTGRKVWASFLSDMPKKFPIRGAMSEVARLEKMLMEAGAALEVYPKVEYQVPRKRYI